MAKQKQQIKKGKIMVHTSKGIFPYSALLKAETTSKQEDSKQLKNIKQYMNQNGLVTPPYAPVCFLQLYESSPVFCACVNQLAEDAVGNGWTLSLKEKGKESNAEYDKIKAFLDHSSGDQSFEEILKELIIDWGTIGWFFIEEVKSLKGELQSIYRIPAHTMRIHEDKEKYCQIRNNKKVWFKRHGSKNDIKASDGKEGKKLTYKIKANEAIYFKNFYPRSDYYGAPKILASTGDLIALIGVRDYNLNFFENYGVPIAIVILEGEWEDDATKRVEEFLEKEILLECASFL